MAHYIAEAMEGCKGGGVESVFVALGPGWGSAG
jgi:hypothetical protein